MNFLLIDVYKHGEYDCTNGGITSKYDTLYVACNDGYLSFPEDNLPENAVKVVKRNLFGREVVHLEPINGKQKGFVGWMAGGNYAASSDSRFSDMIGFYGAVSVHDRQESHELYDMLSR